MRTLYDSVSWNAIPTNAAMVAGYVDGAYKWPGAAWDRFPSAVKIRIAVFPATNDGDVLDVEDGDATPEQAPGWVRMRRAAGHTWPTVYCSRAYLPVVRSAFASQGVAEPYYWVADWTGSPHLVEGSVATQYANPPSSGGSYDLSVAVDTWPGRNPQPHPPTPAPTPGGTVTVNVPVLSKGNIGSYVANVQVLLNTHNGHLHVDGIYGPSTEDAVRRFQKVTGLAVDGIVGGNTWSRLLSVNPY